MIKLRFILISIIVTTIGFPLVAGAVAAIQPKPGKPLLMPGKQSLYQRVLSRPGATLSSNPKIGGKKIQVIPFTVYYVYKRKIVNDSGWVQVGSDSHGTIEGWLDEKQTIPWKQTLTVAFRRPSDHGRVLLFRDRASLKSLVDTHDVEAYGNLYQEAEKGEAMENSPVIAIQPKAHVNIKDNFYLVPIQQHEDVFLGAEQALMLQVTTVPLTDAKVVGEDVEFQSGLVFVIDSTVSMGPYIDRTREAVHKVYNSIEAAGLESKVNFGLVAYRDNPKAKKGLGYLTRNYANLSEGRDASSFFQKVNALKPASISSQDFIEDAYAGVKQALDEMEWRGHDARYIVLITDAGARNSQDPLGKTGMDAGALRQLAQDKGVAIWVLHLLTPTGKENHASAAEQYKELSYYPGVGNFYYGVRMGEVFEFGRVLDALAAQITQQVRDTVNGVPPMAVPDDLELPESDNESLAKLQQKVAKLGYALRMQYLERKKGEQIPSVFNAWMIDRDFKNPERSTLDVQVLLTRDQLSNLQSVLKQVLDTAEEGLLSPSNFINDLKSLAATLSRDPSKVGRTTRITGAGENLADLGFMREYIENLPYTGEVMNLSLESWEDWSAKRQFEFINRLEGKISYYQALHDNIDLWISLDGGSVDGDSVFPISLDALP